MITDLKPIYTSIGKRIRAVQVGTWCIYWRSEKSRHTKELDGFFVYERDKSGSVIYSKKFDSVLPAIHFADMIADEIEPWPSCASVLFKTPIIFKTPSNPRTPLP